MDGDLATDTAPARAPAPTSAAATSAPGTPDAAHAPGTADPAHQAAEDTARPRACLPRDVLPSHYDLHLVIEDARFTGRVTMQLHAAAPTTTFLLNSSHLEIASAALIVDGARLPAEHAEDPAHAECVRITAPQPLSGDFSLEIAYAGVYSTDMAGIYRTEYHGNALVSTHFESADARRAFPCFDQPDMKARFRLTIDAPAGTTALANMPVASHTGTRFVFEETPKMPTYIVAFVVGRLEHIEMPAANPSRTLIRVYAAPGEAAWGDLALRIAARCLPFFEEYFGIAYPLPKLDMVAIPAFAMGAMENWGLVTYRATSLLFDPATTPIRARKNIAVTVCHELAHMWFGNLVTMAWWDDLWLNEGFATWAATLAIAGLGDLLPWDAWTAFVRDEHEEGMALDSLRSTHRIAVDVREPVEVEQVFDAISYSKGASIIRMVEGWLGADVFRRGVAAYLRTHSYANTRTADLWAALDAARATPAASGEDVAAVVGPWTDREGFPCVEVRLDSDERVTLVQQRFTLGHEATGAPWPIPIEVCWETGAPTRLLLRERETTIARQTPLFKVNVGAAGFYRVHYPMPFFTRLVQKMAYAGAAPLATADRLNLFCDAFALARGLRAPLPLAALPVLAAESSFEVLAAVLDALHGFASTFYDRAEAVADFRAYAMALIEPRVAAVVLEQRADAADDVNRVALEELVVRHAVLWRHEETLARLRALVPADGDLRQLPVRGEFIQPLYAALADTRFADLEALVSAPLPPAQHTQVIMALGAVDEEAHMERLLANYAAIPPQDAIYYFAALSGNMRFRDRIVAFFVANFDALWRHIANDGIVRHAVTYTLGSALSEEAHANATRLLARLDGVRAMKSAVGKTRDALALKMLLRERYANFEYRKEVE